MKDSGKSCKYFFSKKWAHIYIIDPLLSKNNILLKYYKKKEKVVLSQKSTQDKEIVQENRFFYLVWVWYSSIPVHVKIFYFVCLKWRMFY